MAARPFIHEDFLLHTDAARELYHRYAAAQPIFDYHCHLPQAEILADRRFPDLATVWLGGDHYKWRAMRACGVPERCCTGDAPPREKHDAWCRSVPQLLRNPLYHWSHLEAARFLGFDGLIGHGTADALWEAGLRRLPDWPVRTILDHFRVAVVGTTDDPAAPLDDHLRLAAAGLRTRVVPTFRPDAAFGVDQPAPFRAWCERLGHAAGRAVTSLDDLLAALRRRHDDFHAAGARLSDHGLEALPAAPPDPAAAGRAFATAWAGRPADPADHAAYVALLLREFGRWDAARGWTKQFHLGCMRRVNTRRTRELGPDTGYDTIADAPQGRALAAWLDDLEAEGALPRVVLYNLNPADNYLFAALAGCFQDGVTAGRIQFGSGWWFLDQKQGMEWQLDALSATGVLARFVGMLTDSRSFLSFTRHEYFRRILCNVLGGEMERGELPDDAALVGGLVADVCFGNARRFFGIEVDPAYATASAVSG